MQCRFAYPSTQLFGTALTDLFQFSIIWGNDTIGKSHVHGNCLVYIEHIEGLTKGASQKSGSQNETDLLKSYLVNLSHLVNQKTFIGHLLC